MELHGLVYECQGRWLRPLAFIALSAIPVGAGVVRIVELARGVEITPANARFFAAPVPVVLHILSVSLFCVLGAFQFAPAFRRKPRRHRAAGRLLVFCGVAGGLSGSRKRVALIETLTHSIGASLVARTRSSSGRLVWPS